MAREPYMPLYLGDFLAATSEWEGEEASLYLMLLAHQWALGSLPREPEKLCRICRWTRKNFDRYWPQVSQKFVERDGRLVNARLEEHRGRSAEIAGKRAQAGKRGAAIRHSKEMAIARDVPEQNGGNCQNFALPSNSIQSNPEENSVENPSQDTHSVPLAARARGSPHGQDLAPAPTRASAACVAMRSEGLMTANPSHPVLLQLIAEGAEIGELAQAAREAHASHKGFGYALAIARNRRAEAARLGATGLKGALPAKMTATEELLANLDRPRVIDHDA